MDISTTKKIISALDPINVLKFDEDKQKQLGIQSILSSSRRQSRDNARTAALQQGVQSTGQSLWQRLNPFKRKKKQPFPARQQSSRTSLSSPNNATPSDDEEEDEDDESSVAQPTDPSQQTEAQRNASMFGPNPLAQYLPSGTTSVQSSQSSQSSPGLLQPGRGLIRTNPLQRQQSFFRSLPTGGSKTIRKRKNKIKNKTKKTDKNRLSS